MAELTIDEKNIVADIESFLGDNWVFFQEYLEINGYVAVDEEDFYALMEKLQS